MAEPETPKKRFTRIDDDVAVGIGATTLYRRGETVDTDDINLITLFSADPGWRDADPESELDDDGGTGQDEADAEVGDVPPSWAAGGVTSPQTD